MHQYLLTNQTFRHIWAGYRSRLLHERYQRWSEHYAVEAERRKIAYSPENSQALVRHALIGRTVRRRSIGQIHTLIVTITSNWGLGMVYELEHIGKVSVFDYSKLGFHESDRNLDRKLPQLNKLLLDFVRSANADCPIDWILFTCSGRVILKTTLQQIRDELGIPMVNQWLDCKQNFEGGLGIHGQDTGQKDIAPEFDLCWTSSRSVCEWYLVVGAVPLFLPEGFSPRLTPRISIPAIYDVGFLGMNYGLRRDCIAQLRRAHLSVAVAGHGWLNEHSPVALSDMGRFFNQCKVNLGMGGIGYSSTLRTLKGRDFEVPGAGGAYLTTFNPDLADFFEIGREILCYGSYEELVEQARRLVHDDIFREEIKNRAYIRAQKEHRWMHRFITILQTLGILETRSSIAV